MPEDLLKFGLIPEFIGRLPIVVTLDALDELALRRILIEPRNALVRQFQKIMDMDGVDLQFTKEALVAIAIKAQSRKTGARGLRSILEEIDARRHVRPAVAARRQEVRRQQRSHREERTADARIPRTKERHARLRAHIWPNSLSPRASITTVNFGSRLLDLAQI